MHTRIKICGITTPRLAQVAAQAGADAIGLMFYPPSSRNLEIDQARQIRQSVPPYVTTVAVMVNPEAETVQNIIRQVSPAQLQFHGEEDNDFCNSFGLPWIKVQRMSSEIDLKAAENCYPDCRGILLDTHVADKYGGSGKVFNWSLAQYDSVKPVILAGGLLAENVVQAIDIAKPYAVDVSSGVETNGIKDPEKIQAFCQKVKNYRS